MLQRDATSEQLNSWGVGQDAAADIRNIEDVHERLVSSYLRGLEVFIIPIDDEPSKLSLRASIESQLIALCSEGLQPIDSPMDGWLGLESPMKTIGRSGLWNLRDVGRSYRPDAVGSVAHIASLLPFQLTENA
jgi:hypothetical protein